MGALMGLRENLQKNYIWTLKDLKNIDAKDLLAKRADNKSEPGALKGLIEYATEADGKITIDLPRLKTDATQKEAVFTQINQSITKKLFETAQWIDEFIRKELNVSKQKQTTGDSKTQQGEKKTEALVEK